jgi:hypothetical protein
MWKMWMLLFICVLCALAASTIKPIETFAINDYYDRYLNDISVPVGFYSQTKYASGFKKIEMNDRFFLDTLSKASVPSLLDGMVPEKKDKKQPGGLIERTNALLVGVLNQALPSGESKIFAAAYSRIVKATPYEDNRWLIESEHIIHRDGKVYGASLSAKTLHNQDSTDLVSFDLKGFVLDDRIDSYEPSNLASWEGGNPSFMQDKTFMKDPKYEHEYICKYIADLEKFRGIKTANAPDCSDIDS